MIKLINPQQFSNLMELFLKNFAVIGTSAKINTSIAKSLENNNSSVCLGFYFILV